LLPSESYQDIVNKAIEQIESDLWYPNHHTPSWRQDYPNRTTC
jgi:hypothetical protein